MERRRLAGYAANIDFWADEIQHRLRLLDGLEERRRAMVAGTNSAYEHEIHQAASEQRYGIDEITTPDVRDVSTDWEALRNQVSELRSNVVHAAKVFLFRCRKFELIDAEKLCALQERLGIVVGKK